MSRASGVGSEKGEVCARRRSGEGRTVSIDDREGGEVVEWCEDLTTAVLYPDIEESTGWSSSGSLPTCSCVY